MGLPIAKLVVATNENDILDRFFRTGRYEKKPAHGPEVQDGEASSGHDQAVKETLSPAMDILISSNFERLLWYFARECETPGTPESEKSSETGRVLKGWMDSVKTRGGIALSKSVLEAAERDFASFRVSDEQVPILPQHPRILRLI
jgi:threonine synthase